MNQVNRLFIIVLTYLMVISISGLISAYTIGETEAAHIVIEGGSEGLIVEPVNEKLFDVVNMYPGVSEDSKITLINNGPGKLTIDISLDLTGDEILQKALVIRIFDAEKNYYQGSLFDLSKREDSLDIGMIEAGESKELDFVLKFETGFGNQTQNKSTSMTWFIKATMKDEAPIVKTANLYAGQHKKVGIVEVYNNEQELYIKYKLNEEVKAEGWCFSNTHLHLGESREDFPLTGTWGNPVPGLFDHKKKHDNCIVEYEYIISLDNLKDGDVLMVAAHAVIENSDHIDSAWAAESVGVIRFTAQGNWATYFYYTIQ